MVRLSFSLQSVWTFKGTVSTSCCEKTNCLILSNTTTNITNTARYWIHATFNICHIPGRKLEGYVKEKYNASTVPLKLNTLSWDSELKNSNSNTKSKKKESTQPAFIYSKLTIETLGKGVKYVFIVNFKHISHLVLVFLLLTLNM